MGRERRKQIVAGLLALGVVGAILILALGKSVAYLGPLIVGGAAFSALVLLLLDPPDR